MNAGLKMLPLCICGAILQWMMPVYADDGTPLRSIGTTQDVTDRGKAQNEIVRHKSLLESVFRAVPDAMVIADLNRDISFSNPGTERVFGYSEDELKGKKTLTLYESPEEFERQGRERFNMSAEEKLLP